MAAKRVSLMNVRTRCGSQTQCVSTRVVNSSVARSAIISSTIWRVNHSRRAHARVYACTRSICGRACGESPILPKPKRNTFVAATNAATHCGPPRARLMNEYACAFALLRAFTCQTKEGGLVGNRYGTSDSRNSSSGQKTNRLTD